MESALYEGWISHVRRAPVRHAFRYRLFLAYLDLAELDRVFAGSRLGAVDGPGVAVFRRRDHLGDPSLPLDGAVRDLVERRTGSRPQGPIRLLTQLRTFGILFNPVSFYYCFDRGGARVEAIVADVTNIPWKERHCYVLPRSAALDPRAERALRFASAKEFHVSPFMPMDVAYDWYFGTPGDALHASIATRSGGERFFEARLELARRAITGPALARALASHPLLTARVIAAIYWQAFRLRRKRAPVHPHPDEARPPADGLEEGLSR